MPVDLKLSETAPVTVSKTRLHSKELPCFSTLSPGAKPFFKQWYIYTIDAIRILSLNYAEAREVLSEIRSLYGKAKTGLITVDEFNAFTGISKKIIRMHLVSRVMEGELKKRESAIVNRQSAMLNCET